MSVLQSMSVYQRIKKKCKGNTENEAQPEQPSPAYNMLSGVMGCFNVAWFFAGKFIQHVLALPLILSCAYIKTVVLINIYFLSIGTVA